jgi:hypothetical protein
VLQSNVVKLPRLRVCCTATCAHHRWYNSEFISCGSTIHKMHCLVSLLSLLCTPY